MAIVTINSVDYDTYATIAEASEYLSADFVLASVWSGLTSDQQAQVLVSSARRFDTLSWKGDKTSDSQPLAWPRSNTTITGVDDSAIPEDIVNASIMYAALVAQTPDLLSAQNQSSNTKRLKAGSAEIEYFSATSGSIMPTRVNQLLLKYLDLGTFSLFQAYGFEEDFTLSESDYDLTEGF